MKTTIFRNDPVPRALAITYRNRDGSIRPPTSLSVGHSTLHLDHTDAMSIKSFYRVEDGPTFHYSATHSRGDYLAAEWRSLEFSVFRQAVEDIRRQVAEYNATIQPVPNGPEDRVAESEAATRIVLASQAMPRFSDATPAQETEWRAAMQAFARIKSIACNFPTPTTTPGA